MNTINNLLKFSVIPIVCVILLINCNSLYDNNLIEQQNGAIQFAYIHSGANSIRYWEDIYWDNVATYMDVQDYNNAMDLDRLSYLKYTSSKDAWRWASDSLRTQFYQMRQELN